MNKMMYAAAQPLPSPLIGQMYFNTSTQQMQMWDGSQWVSVVIKVWNLFIDDIRADKDVDLSPGWLGVEVHKAKTCEEAIALLEEHGLPDRVTFDHDLGEGQQPATHIMWHIINGHLDNKWDCALMKEVQIHSANPVGARNLLLLWEGFCKEHGIDMDIRLKPALK